MWGSDMHDVHLEGKPHAINQVRRRPVEMHLLELIASSVNGDWLPYGALGVDGRSVAP